MLSHLHIIHLPHRADRLAVLLGELAGQNISACIWPGILHETNPKKGIAAAHKQIVAFAKKENLTEIIIAEDDIHFTAPFAFDHFLKRKPSEFDLYLGGIYHGNINSDNTVNDFAGLMLYIIHENFYNTFLSVNENMDIDRELAERGKFIVCNPFVAIQHNGYSDNKKKDINYDECLKGRLLFR